jgi:UDP-N-acetylmuramoyl-L-alanyl-D-glutamate--2,6-diaminopimelate ligase
MGAVSAQRPSLGALAQELGGRLQPAAAAEIRPRRLCVDSREVGPGDLFAALPGARQDGRGHAREALQRGAAALLLPDQRHELLDSGAPLWLHPEPRALLGRAAARLLGDPAREMTVVAVTGTNGKTTVAALVAQLLESAGRRPALFGTIEHRFAGRRLPSHNTSPEPAALQGYLAEHRAAGGDSVSIEASSHGLDQRRLDGLPIHVAIFTNLTRDHLDYHGDMRAYQRAKRRLFESLEPGGLAILPEGGASAAVASDFARAAIQAGARVLTYGVGSRADLSASRLSPEAGGIRMFLHGMGISWEQFFLPLLGQHNVENALAALAAVLGSGASPSALQQGLARASSPAGRLELVSPPGHPFRVFVDYAHTPDALQVVCTALRADLERQARQGGPRGRLLCLFGCGGDKDKGKRPAMGAAVGRLADLAVVTSDNPRSEDPMAIIGAVLLGLAETPAESLVEPDRRRAIELALERARPGDVVLLAGKGHEREQEIAGRRLPFDDAAVARELLS